MEPINGNINETKFGLTRVEDFKKYFFVYEGQNCALLLSAPKEQIVVR